MAEDAEGWQAGLDDGALRWDGDVFNVRLRGRVTCVVTGAEVVLSIEYPRSALLPDAGPISYRFPRTLFTGEEQISRWFTSVCDELTAAWYRVSAFETAQHIFDVALLAVGELGGLSINKEDVIAEHLKATANDLMLRLDEQIKRRGRFSKWTGAELKNAVFAVLVVGSASTLQDVWRELGVTEPERVPKSAEALRKLLSRFGLSFEDIKREAERERGRRTGQ